MRRVPARLRLFAVLGALTLMAFAAQGAAYAQSIAVDGFLEADYAAFGDVVYTRDQGGTFTGKLSVVETPDAYYFGFQQALEAKSNSYCQAPGKGSSCYQKFSNLVGSDYISFDWTIGARQIYVPSDILKLVTPSGEFPSGYAGVEGGGDGGSITGIDPAAVKARSGMDYNLNKLCGAGWRDFLNSPDLAGPSDPGYSADPCFGANYIYRSQTEVRLDKALGQLADGLTLTDPEIVAHNSPAAPTEGQPIRFLECLGASSSGTVGGTVTLTVEATENGDPKAGAPVLAQVVSGPGTVQSVGVPPQPAPNRGTTASDGRAAIVVTSPSAATTVVRAVWDVDNDGNWDQATEPASGDEAGCRATFVAAVSYDLAITKTVDKATALRGDSLLYTVKVTNTGGGTLTNLVITDSIPAGTTYVAGSASGAGVFDSAAKKLTWTLASLDAEASMTVTFRVTINADAPATITNVAVAKADQAGPKEAQATTTVSDALGGQLQAGQAIPRTGTQDAALLLLGLALIGAGDVLSSRRLAIQLLRR